MPCRACRWMPRCRCPPPRGPGSFGAKTAAFRPHLRSSPRRWFPSLGDQRFSGPLFPGEQRRSCRCGRMEVRSGGRRHVGGRRARSAHTSSVNVLSCRQIHQSGRRGTPHVDILSGPKEPPRLPLSQHERRFPPRGGLSSALTSLSFQPVQPRRAAVVTGPARACACELPSQPWAEGNLSDCRIFDRTLSAHRGTCRTCRVVDSSVPT